MSQFETVGDVKANNAIKMNWCGNEYRDETESEYLHEKPMEPCDLGSGNKTRGEV